MPVKSKGPEERVVAPGKVVVTDAYLCWLLETLVYFSDPHCDMIDLDTYRQGLRERYHQEKRESS